MLREIKRRCCGPKEIVRQTYCASVGQHLGREDKIKIVCNTGICKHLGGRAQGDTENRTMNS